MAATNPTAAPPLLSVRGLETRFFDDGTALKAVDGLSFDVARGETLCIVGESGCGKSVSALSVMRLLPPPPASRVDGQILLEGKDLGALSEREMRRIRGNSLSMIFQEPMTSLNPVVTVGYQIAEAVRQHEGKSWAEGFERAVEMLRLVRIPEPERRVKEYPHQLSGGMRQRVMIAMALACRPRVLLADEPTTALDVTIQAQILELMRELQDETGTAIVLITHDLGVVAEMAHRVVVMYAGRKVEEASVGDLFERPCHPYTVGLMGSIPELGSSLVEGKGPRRLAEIPGIVPSLRAMPPGCRFAPRCPLATDRCRTEPPPLEEHRPRHWSACWHWERAQEAIHVHA
ncbi:peptide/nickel transport system ATP-binding protein [Stella humosa]|uniref:Peptide/nickel transport system ATP-binding protein n=1 Tax=Stella humosa TaxID=94 RepID=A0A3N1MEF3_9PROT|nr:ABC transporter ATP-binding protein [Stella humosa]ROQ01938.1 peptide/nickel transport system ATP-binding protein [Stella humosa]BBK32327.1 ABC transporter ATP-binding protein [Stella humosa]